MHIWVGSPLPVLHTRELPDVQIWDLNAQVLLAPWAKIYITDIFYRSGRLPAKSSKAALVVSLCKAIVGVSEG